MVSPLPSAATSNPGRLTTAGGPHAGRPAAPPCPGKRDSFLKREAFNPGRGVGTVALGGAALARIDVLTDRAIGVLDRRVFGSVCGRVVMIWA
jgi:hypothetical protein